MSLTTAEVPPGIVFRLVSIQRLCGRVLGRAPAATPLEEFMRYGLASGIALAADVTVLVTLTEAFGIHYLVSAAAGFALGIAIAYALSVRWVFSCRRLASAAAERMVFFAIGIGGLLLNHIVLFALSETALLPYPLSKAASAVIVFTFNFSLRKVLLFTLPGLARETPNA